MKTVVEISCVEVWRHISAKLDGELEGEMLERVALHLRHCGHCQAVHDGAKNLVTLLGDEELFVLPAGFGGRLMDRLAG